MRREKKYYPLFLSGFGITFIVALFVCLGVYLILFVLGSLPASRNSIVVATILLYALAFAIAKIGLSIKMNLNPFVKSENDESSYKSQDISWQRSIISRVFPLIWLTTGVFSILLLTPAFIIFWFDLLYQDKVIMLFAFIFCASGAAIYYFKNENKFISLREHSLFFIGVCAGSFSAVYISFLIINKKISNL